MNAMRAVVVVSLIAVVELSCGRDQSIEQPIAPNKTTNRQSALVCENCFVIHALDRYLALPNRYVVRRSASDNCLVLTAPFSNVQKELGTPQYRERLRAESGLIRYCDRLVLDRDVGEIVEKAGAGVSQFDGEVAIRSWTPTEMSTPFTATYFVFKNEGLLIFDVNRNFAAKIWRDGIRDRVADESR